VGLTINLNKCSLWGPGLGCPVGNCPMFPVTIGLEHPIRAVPVVDYCPGSGITVLGTPVHHPDDAGYADTKWDSVTRNASELLLCLRFLPDGQLQHTLLRHCLDACKVNHLLRTTDIRTGALAVAGFSEYIRTVSEDLFGAP